MNRQIERYMKRVKGLKSEGTYKTRRTDLRNFDAWFQESVFEDIEELDALALEEYFIEQAQQDYASTTLANRYQSIKGLFEFLADKLDLYDDSPFENLNPSDYTNGGGTKKRTKSDIIYLTAKEVDELAKHAPAPSLRNELIIRMLFQTGMRVGEIAQVELDDINRDEHSIQVYAEKTDSVRTVFYQPSLDILMDQWIDGGYRDSYPKASETNTLFVGSKGELSKYTYSKKVAKAADASGLQETIYVDMNGRERKKISTHTLRHSHAVNALKSGIDVRTVQRHLGHKKLDMTMKYLQLVENDVREQYRRWDSGDRE